MDIPVRAWSRAPWSEHMIRRRPPPPLLNCAPLPQVRDRFEIGRLNSGLAWREFLRGQQSSNGAESVLWRIGELIDDDAASHPGGPALLDHAPDGRSLASGLNPVINQQNAVIRPQRGSLEAQCVTKATVVGRRLSHDLLAREEALALPDGNEADAELDGRGTAQKESPRLDPADGCDPLITERLNETSDHCGQCPGIPKDRPHIRVTTDPPEVFKSQVTCSCRHGQKSSDRQATQQPLTCSFHLPQCPDLESKRESSF